MEPKIEEIDKKRTGVCNTELTPVKTKKEQPPQYSYWCFTFNNYEEEQIEQLEIILQHECKWYVFQKEIGEKTGTPHLQGTINLKVRQRLTQVKAINPSIHWEPTKSVSKSLTYCTKQKTGVGEIYTHGIELPEPLDLEKPYGWQMNIVQLISEKPNKRTIHWYWESTGGVGKTTLCKWLVEKHDALMLTGKSNDMYHMLSKFPNKRKIIIIDIPRSAQDYINYGAIEQIKNGLVFSGKYEGCQLNFNSPHVIVFANEPPDYDKMSQDRWNVINIKNII